MTACTVTDCVRKPESLGLCGMHYQRVRKTGTTDPIDRFWPKVDKNGPVPDYAPHLGPCWLWVGADNGRGYGDFWNQGRNVRAHRWSWTQANGAVPDGLQLDHLCRVTRCVNPAHLEPVTQRENVRRAKAAITHCQRGHEYTPENTYVYVSREGHRQRHCRACWPIRRALKLVKP